MPIGPNPASSQVRRARCSGLVSTCATGCCANRALRRRAACFPSRGERDVGAAAVPAAQRPFRLGVPDQEDLAHGQLSTGSTCQMSRQYSRIARSDEKRPTRAQFRIDIRVQRAVSQVRLAHARLAVHVGPVVGQHHVLVVRQQRVHERPEQLAVAVGRRARRR